jgi:hypothetical protein
MTRSTFVPSREDDNSHPVSSPAGYLNAFAGTTILRRIRGADGSFNPGTPWGQMVDMTGEGTLGMRHHLT